MWNILKAPTKTGIKHTLHNDPFGDPLALSGDIRYNPLSDIVNLLPQSGRHHEAPRGGPREKPIRVLHQRWRV